MTRARFLNPASGGGASGGGPGGDAVFLGPDYGEVGDPTTGVAVDGFSLAINPSDVVGVQSSFANLDLGPFDDNLGVQSVFANLGLGPFSDNLGVQASFANLDLGPFSDVVGVSDAFSLAINPDDNLGVAASFANLDLGPFSDVVGVSATGGLVLTGLLPTDDMDLDEGNPNANTGSSGGVRAKTDAVLSNNEIVGYTMWDFTTIDGDQLAFASCVLHYWGATSLATGSSVNWTLYTHPTQPFDESTATWNNTEPPPGTSRQTGSQALTTTSTEYTITLNSTALANCAGNYVYLRWVSGTTLGLATEAIRSKDSAGSDKPFANIEVTL